MRKCSSRIVLGLLTAVLLAVGLPSLPVAAQAASFQGEVVVDIVRVFEMLCPDDDCPGDYYAWVWIDGQRFRTVGEVESADFKPADLKRTDWTFRKLVDGAKDTVTIDISLQDSDIGADPNGDDVMDISPGDDDLHATFDLVTGRLSGDVQGGEDGAQVTSFGTPGGSPPAQLFFTVTSSLTRDTDQDGIPDGAELKGFWDDDHKVFTKLHEMGADPCRKTIAVEVDYMDRVFGSHSHRMTDGAVNQVKGMFDAAPVPAKTGADCPYAAAGFPRKATGIDMIIDRDSPSHLIEEAEVMPLEALTLIGLANFTPGRGKYFHYSLFVHNQAVGDDTSGKCCVANKHFIVSLGEWTGSVGTDREQAGTFVHELGHALGLGHGGHDETNFKPNYLSAMNYAFQFGIPSTSGMSVLDYSRSALGNPLDETSLGERSTGCIGSPGLGTTWFDDQGYSRACLGNEPLDWDGDGTAESGTFNIDLNKDGVCVLPGVNGARDTALVDDDIAYAARVGDSWPLEGIGAGDDHTCDSLANDKDPDPTTAPADDKQERAVGFMEPAPLAGSEDWSRLTFRGASAPGADRPTPAPHRDITFAEARRVQGVFSDPDLRAAKSVDKSNVAPGETLNYRVTADNVGLGIANAVQVVDTLPDGSLQQRSVPDVPPGGSRAEAFSYTVPCSATDGTVLINSVLLRSTNVLGGAEVNTANNTASASSTVRRPVLSVSKTATASVNAAEAVTYRVTVANTGSGGAAGVVVKDTLPAGLYYSLALDQGAGPRPSTVVMNADGSRTLTWSLGTVGAGAAPTTIEYTARTSLLALGGTTYTNTATVEFSSTGGCVYAPVSAAAATTVTVAPPTRNPEGLGFWANHPETWTAENRARIQATDQRFDTSGDGVLSEAEVTAAYAVNRGQTGNLQMQLLSTYFNLATRRINAGTAIVSRTAQQLALTNVRGAVIYAAGVSTGDRSADATQVLDEINNNRSERY